MQTTIMHYELHVCFPFRFSMDDKHNLINSVGNQVPETQVSQCYNISNGVLTEAHTVVVAVHCCLVGHFHCAAIAISLYFSF